MLPFYCWDCKRFLKTPRGAQKHEDDEHYVTKLTDAEFEKLTQPQMVQGIRMSRGLVSELIRPDRSP